MERKKYLGIDGIEDTIGGPGRYADHPWTEAALQSHMSAHQLRFATIKPTFFADNGKWSYRSYPDLAETCHSTDEKVLKIIKPFTRRFDDFPNLKLTDAEWAEVLEGRWPVEGKIPEADKPNSFKVW
jgi:hypothetical protein